jgi:hypothetical protein
LVLRSPVIATGEGDWRLDVDADTSEQLLALARVQTTMFRERHPEGAIGGRYATAELTHSRCSISVVEE